MHFSKPIRWSPLTSLHTLIEELEVVFEELEHCGSSVADDSIDYAWIKAKVVEELKSTVWVKYQAVLALEEFEDVSKVSVEDVATKLNEIIKALQA